MCVVVSVPNWKGVGGLPAPEVRRRPRGVVIRHRLTRHPGPGLVGDRHPGAVRWNEHHPVFEAVIYRPVIGVRPEVFLRPGGSIREIIESVCWAVLAHDAWVVRGST